MGCVALDFCSLWIKFWQILIAFFQRKVMIAAWMNQHRPRWVFFPLFFKIYKSIHFSVTFSNFQITRGRTRRIPFPNAFFESERSKGSSLFRFPTQAAFGSVHNVFHNHVSSVRKTRAGDSKENSPCFRISHRCRKDMNENGYFHSTRVVFIHPFSFPLLFFLTPLSSSFSFSLFSLFSFSFIPFIQLLEWIRFTFSAQAFRTTLRTTSSPALTCRLLTSQI